jgi:Ca2+-transporting ATPase
VLLAKPKPAEAGLLDECSGKFVIADGLVKAGIGLGLLLLLPALGASLAVTATSVFVYEAIAKLCSAYPARRFGNLPETNLWLHVALAASVILQIACVLSPALRQLLGLAVLDASQWAVVAGALLVSLLAGESLARWLSRRSSRVVRA